MNLPRLKSYLLAKKGAVEEYPFGPDAMVIKVMGKMFALVAIEEDPLRITLKCDPHLVEALREMYKAVKPGYHMNKRHWNTVYLDGTIEDARILEMVDDSYDLVVKGLKKGDYEKLRSLTEHGQ
jgi:predicted DNA-binding protein (MmcQ/YjbR family)